MLAGTFFSIGINDQDVRFSLLGNKQTDELEFSVSTVYTGDFIHLKLWFKKGTDSPDDLRYF
jgi:hypothetical protein